MDFMRKLERQLASRGIRPGPRSPMDRVVPGSAYLSYRNDRTQDGAYSRAQHYNAGNHPDPYQDFSIEKAPVKPRPPKKRL